MQDTNMLAKPGRAEPRKPKLSAERRMEILDTLGLALAEKRKDAIDGRNNSGIEEEWLGDEEFYQGYDDANRHEYVKTASKPTEGGRTSRDVDSKKPGGSTVFPNITQPYVDAAAARVGDMLLPTDDRNFAVDPTPIPELEAVEAELPKIDPAMVPPAPPLVAPTAVPMQPQGAAVPMLPGMPPAAQPPQALTPAAQALEKAVAEIDRIKKEAKGKAKLAEKRIDDWLVECQYHAELRKCIDDAAKIGSGVLKGPVPVTRKSRKWERDQATGEYVLTIKKEIKPASFRIDPWNFFPDPACGENIQNGSFVWERDHLTAKRLQDLKGGVGPAAYIDTQIDRVLEEGPQKRNETDSRNQKTDKKDLFEIWYFHGSVTAEQLEAAGCDCGPDSDSKRLFPAKLTMVNDRVVKAALNPLDSGEFPYDVLPWKQRPDMPWGTGIAREGRTPQRIVVAATRNLMDNAGASAKPHKVMTDAIEQDGDPWTWRMTSDANINDVRGAMQFFEQPSRQEQLMAIIEMGQTMMERVTGMPMILMGMQGDIQETAQGRNIQNNNGNSVLRRIARLFDSKITEPHIRRYYAWLMEHGEDDAAKGDFQIVARGSAALVERDLQNQQMPAVAQMALNPVYELSPPRSAKELLKSWRFDPAAFELTDEEKQKAAQQPPPKAPQVEVAEINKAKATEHEKAETERLQLKIASDEKMSESELGIARMVAELDATLKGEAISAGEREALMDSKASLANTAMKLRLQREALAVKGTQTMTPATEPPGVAPAGMAVAL
jgi:hypothetical protein